MLQGLIGKVFAQGVQGDIPDLPGLFGTVKSPLVPGYQGLGGVGFFFANVLRLVFLAAGVIALLNFIIAGYQYMMAAGDSKALASAWARIWQSLLGLILIVGSFAFAALLGYLLFGDATYILNPRIYGPGGGTTPATTP